MRYGHENSQLCDNIHLRGELGEAQNESAKYVDHVSDQLVSLRTLLANLIGTKRRTFLNLRQIVYECLEVRVVKDTGRNIRRVSVSLHKIKTKCIVEL